MFIKQFLLLFFFLPYSVFAQFADSSSSFYKAFYYENGLVSSEGLIQDGKPNGYWITYYQNQLRKSEGNRINFLLDGIWKFYDEKGNIENTISYKKGIKNGLYSNYNEQCLLISQEMYVNDIIEGEKKEYFPDTNKTLKIKKTIPFKEGIENGTAYEYNKDGILITIINYKKGHIVSSERINRINNIGKKEGVWKTYFSNKRLKNEERYKNGLLNGYVKKYNKTGKLESAILYIDGKEQNKEDNIADFNIRNTYYKDGTLKTTSTFNLADKKDGVSNSYNEKGEVISTEIYRNGYLLKKGLIDKKGVYQGLWESYYLNGKIKTKGQYKEGKKYGKWEYFFEKGKLEQEGYFDSKGKYTKEWKWYYENGNLLRKEEFRGGKEDGILEEYDKDGKLITKGEYIEGEKDGEWFYELNDHKERGKYRYGERNGFWEFTNFDGKKSFEGNYNEGSPEGKHKYYNKEGDLIREENYRYGKKHGKWKWYDNFGVEILSISYEDGEEKKINGQKVKFIEK